MRLNGFLGCSTQGIVWCWLSEMRAFMNVRTTLDEMNSRADRIIDASHCQYYYQTILVFQPHIVGLLLQYPDNADRQQTRWTSPAPRRGCALAVPYTCAGPRVPSQIIVSSSRLCNLFLAFPLRAIVIVRKRCNFRLLMCHLCPCVQNILLPKLASAARGHAACHTLAVTQVIEVTIWLIPPPPVQPLSR